MSEETDENKPTEENGKGPDLGSKNGPGDAHNKNKKPHIKCKKCGSENTALFCITCGYNDPDY